MKEPAALKTLGTFELAIGDRIAMPLPTHKARALVAFLVANRGRDTSRERLLELFWREFEPQRAREGLRTALSSVRAALRSAGTDPEAILSTNKSVVRWIDGTDFDAECFVRLSERGDVAALDAALQLYGGDFLEGSYEEWAVAERERISAAYENALTKIVARRKDAHAARLLLERNPYSSEAYSALIDVELAADRPGAAAELLKRYHEAMVQMGSQVPVDFEERFAGLTDITDDEIAVPFVARSDELQRFARHFQEQQRGGKGRIDLLIGEPGIGKTTLLARVNEKARAANLRPLTVRGGDDQRRLGSWHGLYHRLTGRNLHQRAGAASEISNELAREMVRSFGKPTVLFVDDAQALVGESFAMFASIARIAADAGHTVIAAARPEARERIEVALSGSPRETIVLHPLGRADVGAAIALTIDSAAPQFADALYERSGGNPLFLVSLLQSLVRGEGLRRDRGRWRIVRPLGEVIELPRDLRTSIEERLHAAGEDAALVACALALEHSATAEDLAAALDYTEPRILDALDDLIRYGLIREGADGVQFDFVHDMLREVSGSVLNPGRRVALHRAFARRFERNNAPESALPLARHLRAAGLSVRAAHAYLQAAKIALTRQAFYDAIECCTDGKRSLEHVAPSGEINAFLSTVAGIRAEAALHLGDASLALEAAEEAVHRARASGSAIEITRALIARASLAGRMTDRSGQLKDALEAAEIAMAAGEARLRARALVQAAEAMLNNGAADDSAQLAREICTVAKEHDDFETLWAAYSALLKAQIFRWHFDAARDTLQEVSSTAERVGKFAQADLHCIQAAQDYLMDRFESAREHIGLAMASQPLPLTLFTARYMQGILARESGDRDLIFQALTQCKAIEPIAKLPPCASALAMLEADALLDRGGTGDKEAASKIAAGLIGPSLTTGLIGWSDCTQLTHARVMASLQMSGTRAALRAALDALEQNARSLPLDCDRAFMRLAVAAQWAGERAICDRATERNAYYRAARLACATNAVRITGEYQTLP